jgi:Na+-driven multidrug efflux pump
LEPATLQNCSDIILIMSFIVALKSFNATNIVGVLRSGGDTRFTLFLDVTFLWVLTIPLGAFAGLILKLPIYLVYLCLMSDEIIKFLIGIWRFRSRKWIRNITREYNNDALVDTTL